MSEEVDEWIWLLLKLSAYIVWGSLIIALAIGAIPYIAFIMVMIGLIKSKS